MSAADEDVPITRELCHSVAPTGFAMIAFALSFIGTVQCNVIKFTSINNDSYPSPVTVQFGFWTHEDIQFYQYTDTSGTNGTAETGTYAVLSCASYDEGINIESKWKAAAAFSIIPLIIVGINFIFKCVAAYKVGNAKVNWVDCIVYLLAFLFSGLSIMFLDTSACKDNPVIQEITNKSFRELEFQESCSMSTGMKCIISATVFWLVSAFASADAYKAKMQKENNNVQQQPLTEPLIGDSVLY